MVNSAETRETRRNEIRDEIVTSKEALEILGFSRTRLNQIVKDGRIIPIHDGIYLKDDILAFKNGEVEIVNRPPNQSREWLIAIRKEKGLNQGEVAKQADISISYYSSIERGVKTPAEDTARLLAETLGFDVKKFDE